MLLVLVVFLLRLPLLLRRLVLWRRGRGRVLVRLERLLLHGERRVLPRMLPVRLKPAAAVIERALALPEVHRGHCHQPAGVLRCFHLRPRSRISRRRLAGPLLGARRVGEDFACLCFHQCSVCTNEDGRAELPRGGHCRGV
jgi:hypothetical protein